MGAIDSSIVSVALPHMMGTLGATVQEITWISTGYIIANVVVMPLHGVPRAPLRAEARLHALPGAVPAGFDPLRHRAHADPLIVYRAIQGLGAGALQPTEQAILRQTFPPKEQGMAMALFAMAVMLGPAVGPDAGRLDRRQLLVAVDLLHQRPGRHPGPRHGGDLRPRGRGHRRQEPRARRGPAQEHRLVGHRPAWSSGSARCSTCSRKGSRTTGSSRRSSSSTSWSPSWSSRRSSSASSRARCRPSTSASSRTRCSSRARSSARSCSRC